MKHDQRDDGRSFVGSAQVYRDKSQTSLLSSAVVIYAFHLIISNSFKEKGRNLITQGLKVFAYPSISILKTSNPKPASEASNKPNVFLQKKVKLGAYMCVLIVVLGHRESMKHRKLYVGPPTAANTKDIL